MSAPAPIPERQYCPLDDALFAAYHEAGHAVAALLVDPPRPLDRVRIESDADGCGGHTRYVGADKPMEYSPAATGEVKGVIFAESDATVTLAGPLCAMWQATGHFMPEDVMAEDMRWALDHCLLKRMDWHRVGTIAVQLYGIGEEANEWLFTMFERAFELVARPGFRECVSLVAGGLLREGMLSGAEVEAIVHRLRPRNSR